MKQTISTQSQFSPGALPNKPPPAGFAPNAGAAAALPKSEGAGAGEIVIVMAQHVVSISNNIRRLSTTRLNNQLNTQRHTLTSTTK